MSSIGLSLKDSEHFNQKLVDLAISLNFVFTFIKSRKSRVIINYAEENTSGAFMPHGMDVTVNLR